MAEYYDNSINLCLPNNAIFFEEKVIKKNMIQNQELDNEFYVKVNEAKHNTSDDKQCKYILLELNNEIYNSTNAFRSTTENFLIEKLSMQLSKSNDSSYSTRRFVESDILTYRQSRSELLLLKIIMHSGLKLIQNSLMRLSKGVFIHQKFQYNNQLPLMNSTEDILYIPDFNTRGSSTEAIFNNMVFQSLSTDLNCDSSSMTVPYTYTLGVRFTNPYEINCHDLIVRGKLPSWCQTLFLTNCLNRTIEPNKLIYGLFSFAPQIAVTFQYFNPNHNRDTMPELTTIYEDLTMEHLDPFDFPDDDHYEEMSQKVLNNILICDIPDDSARLINHLSLFFVSNQNINI